MAQRLVLAAAGALCVLGATTLAIRDLAGRPPHRATAASQVATAVAPALPRTSATAPTAPVAVPPARPAAVPPATVSTPTVVAAPAAPVPGAWAKLAELADGHMLRPEVADLLLTANLAAFDTGSAIHAARAAMATWLPSLPAPRHVPPTPRRAAAALPSVLVLSDATLPLVTLHGGSSTAADKAREVLQRAGFSVAPGHARGLERAAVGFFFAPDRASAAAVGQVLAPAWGVLPLRALGLSRNPPPPGSIEVDLPPAPQRTP